MESGACPNCAAPRPPEADSCPGCGVVYAKWKPREERISAAPTTKVSPAGGTGLAGGLLLAAVAGAILWQMRPQKSSVDAPVASEAAPPEAVASASAAAPPQQAAQQSLLDELNAELSAHGTRASLDDIKWEFDRARQPLSEAVLRWHGTQAGLPAPERRAFDTQDKAEAGGSSVKCVVNGKSAYGETFVEPGQGASECWRRAVGERTISRDFNASLVQIGAKLDFWDRYVWQTNTKRWAPCDEACESTVLLRLISTDYGSEAESKDREESRKMLERERSNPRSTELGVKQALLRAYQSRVKRAGAQQRLDELNRF